MSLVAQGRGVSRGTLECLGVVGSRCLGSSGSPLRLSDPFPVTTSSLPCSDSPSQLQPQFHQGAGVVRCGVRTTGKGGHRDRASFSGVLQLPLCHSQSHRGLATCHRPLTPQWLGGTLVFVWRLPSPFSSLSIRGIGWCPWISRTPTSRFLYIRPLTGS